MRGKKEKMSEKGRGAQSNPHNRFMRNSLVDDPEYLEHCAVNNEPPRQEKTKYLEIFPKTIVTPNTSPDVPFKWSINPYQGCEHGCSYCYARNTHEYWGYSVGSDFEKIVLVKHNAPQLLHKKLSSKSWSPELVVLSGNTDCYQPAERKFEITRKLLKVFLDHKHPVGMITKNHLITRDLDYLVSLNEQNLVAITLSITTLNEDTRRYMEPRTSSIKQRLKTLETLVKHNIPVNVNLAPIIPGINSHEIFDLVKRVGDLGANSVNYIMVRLNGKIAEVFSEWLKEAYPDRAEKVLNLIRDTRDGSLNDSRWGIRMRGSGQYAEQIASTFKVARKKFIQPSRPRKLDFSHYIRESEQMRLF
jgi:DNA repair photolyase